MRRPIRRLTFVTDAPHFGGAERYIVSMAQAARRRGIEPHIYWSPVCDCAPEVFKEARTSGVHVTEAAALRRRTWRGMAGEFRAMLHSAEPDALVINACGRPRFWGHAWLAWWADVPAVWIHHMVDACDHRRLGPKWFGGRVEGLQWWRVGQTVRHRLAASAASAVVALNREDRERIARWHEVRGEKIRVIPPGVDCERFRFRRAGRVKLHREWGLSGGVPAGQFVVGTAGRLSGEKRVDLVIEAAGVLRARGIPVVVVIAGEGVERERLVELARARGVADAVRFMGLVEDMAAFYSALDAFVLCSETESFGLALAEAMACERAVAGTPTAGVMRQIDHLDNGWELKGFSAVELADALAAMFADPAARERLGRRGRESVMGQFSIELTFERTLRALRGAPRERWGLDWPGMSEGPFVHMAAEDVA